MANTRIYKDYSTNEVKKDFKESFFSIESSILSDVSRCSFNNAKLNEDLLKEFDKYLEFIEKIDVKSLNKAFDFDNNDVVSVKKIFDLLQKNIFSNIKSYKNLKETDFYLWPRDEHPEDRSYSLYLKVNKEFPLISSLVVFNLFLYELSHLKSGNLNIKRLYDTEKALDKKTESLKDCKDKDFAEKELLPYKEEYKKAKQKLSNSKEEATKLKKLKENLKEALFDITGNENFLDCIIEKKLVVKKEDELTEQKTDIKSKRKNKI